MRTRKMLGPTLALALTCVLSAACSSSTESIEPSIVTDSDRYALQSDGQRLFVDIPYSYHNRTGAPIYLAERCGQGFAGVTLERWEDGRWTGAWNAVLNSCFSDAIRVEADETFEDTLHVSSWLSTGSFVAPPADGATYRIVWIDAYSAFISDRAPPRVLEPYRVSSGFLLTPP